MICKPPIIHLTINPIPCPDAIFESCGLKFSLWHEERQSEMEEVGFCIPSILPTQFFWIRQMKWVISNWEILGISALILEFPAGHRTQNHSQYIQATEVNISRLLPTLDGTRMDSEHTVIPSGALASRLWRLTSVISLTS